MSQAETEIHSPELSAKKPPKQFIPPHLLKSWTPTITWRSTVILYLAIGLASFLYGVLISWFNSSVTEIQIDYDKICVNQTTCWVSATVPEKMQQPVFLYYGLSNFYQNHRLYLVSRSPKQLAGHELDKDHIEKDCGKNYTYNYQMEKKLSYKNEPLVDTAVAHPCGLIAKAYFTDTYEFWSADKKRIAINDGDISWPKGKGSTFVNGKDHEKLQWVDVEDEHFMVWMKTGVFAEGRKLWGKIETDLEPGDYFMKINNTYDVNQFNGKKYIVLTTSNIFGGKVEFLASTFLVIGMIFLLISLCFFNRSKETKKVDFGIRGVTN